MFTIFKRDRYDDVFLISIVRLFRLYNNKIRHQ